MIDLTQYSDDELSMQVFNTEYLYVERYDWDYLVALCREEFIFTDAQLAVLDQDVCDDMEASA